MIIDEELFAENMRHFINSGYLSAWMDQARITCTDCGSLVWDKWAHDAWHDRQGE